MPSSFRSLFASSLIGSTSATSLLAPLLALCGLEPEPSLGGAHSMGGVKEQ
eukprot:CAMPEP_0114162540 /NCGR_PEP_ID=MMETSP0043_2-20121206/29569_1 /TAXON_ID=464988 /ORGANISM="Hemiselmis andersenii, Strain CCMP644" /LENGTH=50 /DNA_ID=CAMNT_0001258901 /DNA_START=66 /DNA_END=218 /DNA_ORIENTATION=+